MRTVVGGTRRAAPPQVQPRPDLRHYFATTNEKHRGRGCTCSPAPGAAPPRSAGCSRVYLEKLEEETSHERMWKTFESNIILKMGHSQPAWESRGMLLSLEQLDITVSFASSHLR